MDEILFKIGNIGHIDRLMEIEKKCFSEPWTKKMFVSEIENELTRFYCIFKENELVGFISIWLIIDEMHINNLAVDINYQNKGYASEMIKMAFQLAKINDVVCITLEVRENNIRAINLYTKFKFIIIGKRKNYYKNPLENALIMKKQINGSELIE